MSCILGLALVIGCGGSPSEGEGDGESGSGVDPDDGMDDADSSGGSPSTTGDGSGVVDGSGDGQDSDGSGSDGEGEGDATAGEDSTSSGGGDSTTTDSGSDTGGIPCNEDAECDDLSYCSGVETCEQGFCQAGTPVTCEDDGIACTVEFCDENLQACSTGLDDSICDDQVFCNGVETCDAEAGCLDGEAIVCNDDIGCTEDACNEDADACTFTPQNDVCQNDSVCDGEEVCDPVADCQPGPALDCNDFVGCTMDSCDEAQEGCVNQPVDDVCDNDLFCDGEEVCNPQTGCEPGDPIECDADPHACTIEACDEDTQTCQTTLDNNECNDGAFCTSGGCQVGEECQQDSDCDDSLACNGVETCDTSTNPGVCKAGVTVQCFDGVACTTDACAEPSGECVYTPVNTVCRDNNQCDGEEVCDPIVGCINGDALDCDDGIDCTDDQCFPAFGCFNPGDDLLCDDGTFCNGAEVCDPEAGCQPAAQPIQCQGDGITCTDEVCDEDANSCRSIPDDSDCPCGSYCSASAGGCTDACSVKACDGKVYQCGDCADNDQDCSVDDRDPDCFGVCANNEATFKGDIPGQNSAPCKMDCYFDNDSGSGNDSCYWSHECDPFEPQGNTCDYNASANIPGSGGLTCASAQVTQPNQCETICSPVVPNGCDCFGCCEVETTNGTRTVYLGSTDASDNGSCNADVVDDPALCKSCTQVAACLNTCEDCELCFGETELPPECGGQQQCQGEQQACGLPGQPNCPPGEFCLTGCCVSF